MFKVGDEETKRGTPESSDNPEDNNQTADVGRAVGRSGLEWVFFVRPLLELKYLELSLTTK